VLAVSADGIEGIDHTVQLTHVWIKELDERLGWANKPRAYRLLRTVLQAVRDWLSANEAADLGAQLPTLLRGVYYEHWRPATVPVKKRSRADFLARIEEAFQADPLAFPSDTLTTVFGLLTDKIGAGEIEDVRQSLPADLRALWPRPSRAA
jgi:uncharacterized protein (DUF2267 family)